MEKTGILMKNVALTKCLMVAMLLLQSCMTKKVKETIDQPDGATKAPVKEKRESLSLNQNSVEKERGFAVIGGSFSVGTMSDTSLARPSQAVFDDFFPIASYIKAISKGVNPELDLPRTTVDDSFKQHAFNAFNSSGIESVAVILKYSADAVQNLAISGAGLQSYSENIAPQIQALNDDHEMVLVEIGTGAYCSAGYREESFKKSYEKLVGEIVAKSKNLQGLILLPAFPVFRLADYSDSLLIDFSREPDPLQKFLSEMVFEGRKTELKCEQAHRVFCEPMVNKTREENWSRWESVNAAILAVARDARLRNPELKILYPAELSRKIKMSKEYLSMDCFHLGKKFHENFARELSGRISAEINLPPGNLEPVNEKK